MVIVHKFIYLKSPSKEEKMFNLSNQYADIHLKCTINFVQIINLFPEKLRSYISGFMFCTSIAENLTVFICVSKETQVSIVAHGPLVSTILFRWQEVLYGRWPQWNRLFIVWNADIFAGVHARNTIWSIY